MLRADDSAFPGSEWGASASRIVFGQSPAQSSYPPPMSGLSVDAGSYSPPPSPPSHPWYLVLLVLSLTSFGLDMWAIHWLWSHDYDTHAAVFLSIHLFGGLIVWITLAIAHSHDARLAAWSSWRRAHMYWHLLLCFLSFSSPDWYTLTYVRLGKPRVAEKRDRSFRNSTVSGMGVSGLAHAPRSPSARGMDALLVLLFACLIHVTTAATTLQLQATLPTVSLPLLIPAIVALLSLAVHTVHYLLHTCCGYCAGDSDSTRYRIVPIAQIPEKTLVPLPKFPNTAYFSEGISFNQPDAAAFAYSLPIPDDTHTHPSAPPPLVAVTHAIGALDPHVHAHTHPYALPGVGYPIGAAPSALLLTSDVRAGGLVGQWAVAANALPLYRDMRDGVDARRLLNTHALPPTTNTSASTGTPSDPPAVPGAAEVAEAQPGSLPQLFTVWEGTLGAGASEDQGRPAAASEDGTSAAALPPHTHSEAPTLHQYSRAPHAHHHARAREEALAHPSAAETSISDSSHSSMVPNSPQPTLASLWPSSTVPSNPAPAPRPVPAPLPMPASLSQPSYTLPRPQTPPAQPTLPSFASHHGDSFALTAPTLSSLQPSRTSHTFHTSYNAAPSLETASAPASPAAHGTNADASPAPPTPTSATPPSPETVPASLQRAHDVAAAAVATMDAVSLSGLHGVEDVERAGMAAVAALQGLDAVVEDMQREINSID